MRSIVVTGVDARHLHPGILPNISERLHRIGTDSVQSVIGGA
jgi:hypothetical protein